MKAALVPILAVVMILSLAGNLYQYISSQETQEELAKSRKELAAAATIPDANQSNRRKIVSVGQNAETIDESNSRPSADPSVGSTSKTASNANANPWNNPEEMREVMKSPAMQQMIRSQQKGVIDMMYGELFRYFELEGEEQSTLSELLLDKQMAGMDLGMQLLDPNLSKDERKEITSELKKVKEEADANVKASFASAEDLDFYETYNESLPERWHLHNLRSNLEKTTAPLTGEQEQELLNMMYAERKGMDFENDYSNQETIDLEDFTTEKYERYSEQAQELSAKILDLAGGILSEEQMTTFEASHRQTETMQQMGLNMMAQMMAGGEEGE